MKDKIRLDLIDTEKSLIIQSLTIFRNHLSAQDKPIDSIDDILLKIIDKHRIELDCFDAKIIINSLNNMRYKMQSENQPRNKINNILLKIINETDKQKSFFKEISER